MSRHAAFVNGSGTTAVTSTPSTVTRLSPLTACSVTAKARETAGNPVSGVDRRQRLHRHCPCTAHPQHGCLGLAHARGQGGPRKYNTGHVNTSQRWMSRIAGSCGRTAAQREWRPGDRRPPARSGPRYSDGGAAGGDRAGGPPDLDKCNTKDLDAVELDNLDAFTRFSQQTQANQALADDLVVDGSAKAWSTPRTCSRRATPGPLPFGVLAGEACPANLQCTAVPPVWGDAVGRHRVRRAQRHQGVQAGGCQHQRPSADRERHAGKRQQHLLTPATPSTGERCDPADRPGHSARANRDSRSPGVAISRGRSSAR